MMIPRLNLSYVDTPVVYHVSSIDLSNGINDFQFSVGLSIEDNFRMISRKESPIGYVANNIIDFFHAFYPYLLLKDHATCYELSSSNTQENISDLSSEIFRLFGKLTRGGLVINVYGIENSNLGEIARFSNDSPLEKIIVWDEKNCLPVSYLLSLLKNHQ